MKNKLIVISGGSKGIGKAIIKKFASGGFDVITCARNFDTLENLSREIRLEFPDINFYFMKADLSKENEIKNFIGFIKDKNRKIDVLVNNTGNFIQGSLLNEAEGVIMEMLNTNLLSAYHLSRGIIPLMIKEKSGYVFNMCSTASIIPYTNGGAYCVSKFAMYGMSKVLREELKSSGVKVTSILPGATKTASWDGVDLPEDRFVKPSDIADTIWGVSQLSPNADVEEILIRPQNGDL